MLLRTRRWLALAVAALAGLSGCAGDPLRPGGDAQPENPPLRTDRDEYVARTADGVTTLTIGFRYTNPTNGETYLSGCRGVHPPWLEKWEGGRWVLAYSPTALHCLDEPVVVPAGGTFDYALEVWAAPRGSNTYPQLEVAEIAGTYRLVWRVFETWTAHSGTPGLGREAPLAQRVSNTFRIVR